MIWELPSASRMARRRRFDRDYCLPLRSGWRPRRSATIASHQECRALEHFEKADTLVVDKAGALVEGRLRVVTKG